MVRNRKYSSSIAYLRQLCCSGLSAEIVIPEFLKAVREVIPSNSNTFSILNEQNVPTFHFLGFDANQVNIPIDVVDKYFSPEIGWRAIAHFSRHTLFTGLLIWDSNFYKSDI